MSSSAQVAAAAERVYGSRLTWMNRISRQLTRVQRGLAIAGNWLRTGIMLAATLACSACDTLSGMSDSLFGSGNAPQQGQAGYVKGFLGGVVADEPRAALAARQVLSAGGSAADAAVALGFVLGVTLPSRAGLGGGGACLAYAVDPKSVNQGVPEAILFQPIAPSVLGSNADRPAAVPMLARGLFLLHARYGHLPFEGLIVPAEQLARFGTPAPRILVRDIALVAGPLLADPSARAVFSKDGTPLTEGQTLTQPDLAATLTRIRVTGVGDLYTGALARRIVEASPLAGGPLSLSDLSAALPRLSPPIVLPNRRDRVAFLPAPADGGLAAAAAFQVLQHDPSAYGQAATRALAVAARWRQGGVDPESLLTSAPLQEAALPPLPASTSFATLDREGNVVACVLSMDNLFGTGRILPGLGILLAASPNAVPPPLYAAAIAWNDNVHSFRAAVSGSGQAGAPMAVAVGMLNALRTGQPMSSPVPDPGRANVISCTDYLPGENGSCRWAVDPREPGLAAGGS
jgi:gamma-glutamyltranspeptidase/glutathione hydrolase